MLALILALTACAPDETWEDRLDDIGCGDAAGTLLVPDYVEVEAGSAGSATALMVPIEGAGTVCAIECEPGPVGLTFAAGATGIGDPGWEPDTGSGADIGTTGGGTVMAYQIGETAGESVACTLVASDGEHTVTVQSLDE